MEAVEEKVDNTRLGNIRRQFEGVIPDSWELTTLGEAFKWRSGGTPLRTNPRFYGGDIPWLIIGDLNDGLVTEAATSITEEGLASSATRWVEEGSVLLAMYGSIGKLGIAGKPLTTNQAIAFTKADPHDAKYLFYFLMYSRESLASLGKGATQKNISQAVIKEYPFPLAPLPQQRRIVEAIELQLGRLDAAVAGLVAAKAKLKRYKQAVLKAAFSEGDTASESTWKLQTIGDIAARIVVGYVGPMTQFIVENDGIPLLSTTHIGENEFLDKEPRQIARSFHAKNKKSQVVPGDILIARHGDSGKSCIVPDFMVEAQVSNAVILSVDPRQVLPEYVCYRINFERTVMQESRVGGVLQVVNTKSMEKFPIRVPSLMEQAKIVDEIDRLLTSTEALEATIDAELVRSTRLRQAVLKRAFEGRLV